MGRFKYFFLQPLYLLYIERMQFHLHWSISQLFIDRSISCAVECELFRHSLYHSSIGIVLRGSIIPPISQPSKHLKIAHSSCAFHLQVFLVCQPLIASLTASTHRNLSEREFYRIFICIYFCFFRNLLRYFNLLDTSRYIHAIYNIKQKRNVNICAPAQMQISGGSQS